VDHLSLSLKKSLSVDTAARPPTPMSASSYAVMLHVDSGCSYYRSPAGDLSWSDPYAPEDDSMGIADAVNANIDIEHNEDEHEVRPAGTHTNVAALTLTKNSLALAPPLPPPPPGARRLRPGAAAQLPEER
jgi:hypothetical protein